MKSDGTFENYPNQNKVINTLLKKKLLRKKKFLLSQKKARRRTDTGFR